MQFALPSLRARVLLLIAVPFAVLLALTGFSELNEREKRLASAREDLLDSAREVAGKQARAIERVHQLLVSLTLLPEIRRRVSSPECDHALLSRQNIEPSIVTMVVADASGEVVCQSVPSAQPLRIADRDYFQNALRTRELSVGDYVISRATGTPAIGLGYPLLDGKGRSVGVVAAAIDVGWLNRELAKIRYSEGARLGLIDSNGTVLARYPDPEGWIGRNATDTPFFKAVIAAGGTGFAEERGFDGTLRLYGLAQFAKAAEGSITLWVGMPKDAVVAPVHRQFVSSMLIAAVALILAFWYVWLGGERLYVRPLLALSRAAAELRQGNLAARTGLADEHSEMGRLARSFDHMASELESKERQVVLANRALRVLSAWNEAILRPSDEKALMQAICRAIVDGGGYRRAWVGFAMDDEEKSVQPMAYWGAEAGEFDNLRVSWADTPHGRGPAGKAIRLGTVVVVNDYLRNPDTTPWRENALRYGYTSIIALPLKTEDRIIGALVVYAAEAEAFAEQEAVLLAEVAAQLSSGIGALRSRAHLTRLEVSLKTSEERFRAAAEASLDALVVLKGVRDAAGNVVDFGFTEMNGSAELGLGMNREQAAAKGLTQVLSELGATGFLEKYAQVFATGTPLEEEFPFDTPHRGKRWFRQQVVRIDEGVAISMRDITVWKTAGDQVRASEERLRLSLQAGRMAAWDIDTKNDTSSFSSELGPIFGLAPGEGPGSTRQFFDRVHPADREAVAKRIYEERDADPQGALEFRVLWPDRTVHWVERHGNVIRDAAGNAVRRVGVLMDITQRKQHAIALERANRALKTISAANMELVQAASEPALLEAVCRVVVETGGYRMASVAYPQHGPEMTLTAAAWAGIDEGYLTPVKHTWADTLEGQRPVSRAIRTGKPALSRDIASDPAFAPFRDRLVKPGYASNLALPLLDGTRVIGALSIHAAGADAFDEPEIRLLAELADDLGYGISTLRTRAERDHIASQHAHHEEILRKSLEDSIQAIAATVEMRDPYTSGHQKRVADLAVAIARVMGLSDERIHGLHLAGVVHDLGKISIPAEILSKPGKLSAIEYQLIKTHPQSGYEILKDIEFPWPIAAIVRQHHERLDGSGYPQGLKGDAMLLESRIMAVADVVEAMGSHRPYRPTLGIDVALAEIVRGSGTAYDPAVADACVKLFREGRFVLAN